jgi:uncharacterized membrane protein YdbT with pleckstrin-like domain
MGYVEEVLGDSESVVYRANYHWIYTLGAILWMTIGLLVVIGPVIGLSMLIRKWTTEMAVTTQRFIYKRGWIARQTEEISLGKIEEINLSQSMLGRILGYGHLHLSGVGIGKITLPTIDDPLALHRAIDIARTKNQISLRG